MNYDPSNSPPSDAESYTGRMYSSFINVFWVPVTQNGYRTMHKIKRQLLLITVDSDPHGASSHSRNIFF